MLDPQWVAGFFDGEGCVNFTRCRTSIYPRILVVNTNRQVLELLQEQFGGDISKLSGRKVGWKQGYSWRLSWTAAVEFLQLIYPHLQIKRPQAEVVFAWHQARPGSGVKWDSSEFKTRMHALNAKGVAL